MSDLILAALSKGALSKGARRFVKFGGTTTDFTVTWADVPVLMTISGHTPREVVAVYLPDYTTFASVAFVRAFNVVSRMSGLGMSLTRKRGVPMLNRGGQGSQGIVPGLWYVWNRRDGAVRCRTAFRDDVGEVMREMTWRPAPVVIASTAA